MTTHLILPSNTGDFSTNTTNSFRVKLPYSFTFDGVWEVALTEVTYPISWNTLKKREGKIQVVYKHNGLSVPISVNILSGYYNDIHEILKAIDYALKSEDEHIANKLFMADLAIFKFVKLKRNNPKKFNDWTDLGYSYADIFGRPELVPDPGGSEEGLEKFRKKVTASDKARRKSDIKLTDALSIEFNTDIKRVKITMDTNSIKVIRLDSALQFMLGFRKERTLNTNSLLADYNSDISAGLTNFFIYCNLVEPQCIGNTVKQLLRTVPLTETTLGRVVHKEFVSPHYIGLLSKSFDTVEVEIRDDHGDLIDFQFGKVILKLHFRQKSR